MGSQPVNADLAAELWNELAEVRTSFPPAEELIAKGGLHIGRDRAKFMRSRIAPLVRQLNSDEARTVLGEARRFAALGECFVYLHWVSQAVGTASATFRNYADHYLSSAIPLLEERTGGGPRGAAKGRAQAQKVCVEPLRFFLNSGLDMPVHFATEKNDSEPFVPTAPRPESLSFMLPEVPSTPAGGEVFSLPVGQPAAAQNSHVDIEKAAATPAPETLSAPKTSEISTLGLIVFVCIIASTPVIAGAIVAVAALVAARMGASLSEWSENDWGIVLGVAIVGGLIGFIFMLPGATRPDRQIRKVVLPLWTVSVIVSIIGVACVSAAPNAMKLVDSNVTGLAALMSEQFGKMMSEGSASILSATIICTVVGVVLGAAIGFAFRLLLPRLVPEKSQERSRGPGAIMR